MAENTIQWDKDADGIVTLTLDDPTGSANVMNEHYKESMHKAVERLVAEKDSITGVVITSGKKTFFAGGDLKRMINLGPENAGEAFDTVEDVKTRPAHAGDSGQAGGGRHQRRGARRRPGDRAGLSPPHRRRRQGRRSRVARGHAGPAARRRRRHPHGADARHPERFHQRAEPGHPLQAGQGQGDRPGRRDRLPASRSWSRRQGVDQGQPRGAHPAVGRQGLQDARRHPDQPGAGGDPAVVPVAAAQAAQGRADAGAAGHPGRGRRGRAGGLRHRQPHREPLLHRSWSPARSPRT